MAGMTVQARAQAKTGSKRAALSHRRSARALPLVRAQEEGASSASGGGGGTEGSGGSGSDSGSGSGSGSGSTESGASATQATSESTDGEGASEASAGSAKAGKSAKSAKSAKSGKAGKKEDDEPKGPVPRGSMFSGPQPVAPLNQDSGIGMLETPVTSSPFVASYLSALPAYRTGVSPLLRGVEIGLAHGFFLPGPFIKLGPLRNTPKAELAGTLSGMGLVGILSACLAIYGAVSFQEEEPLGLKTLTGREVSKDPLFSEDGWQRFTAGFTFGGFSGALFCYSAQNRVID
jgi:photosystem I subunit 11